MADQALTVSGAGSGASVPLPYTVPGAGEIILKGAYAHMDGTAAGVSWIPCLRVKTPNGNVMLECIGDTVVAGASADVTWFPGVGPPETASSGSGIQFNTEPQSGTFLAVTTTGVDATGYGQVYTDTGGGGINFIVTGDAGGFFGTSVAVESNDTGSTPSLPFGVDAKAVNNNATAEGLTAEITGTTGTFGAAASIGTATVTAAGSSSTASAYTGTGVTAGSGDATGGSFIGSATGTGREIGLSCNTNGHQTGAKSLALLCLNHLGAAIFEVRDDGSVHIKTGTTVQADL